MAGVALAWLLDGAYDVVLIEARDAIGGNIRSVEVELDGHELVVDMGAQYFHPQSYPVYTALLGHLGLASSTHPFAASITLTSGLQTPPRFVSPALPERWWPFFAAWNSAGVLAFGLGFLAAKAREQLNQSWDLTLEEWLPTLGLPQEQWEGMLLPFAASLFSGSLDQARGMSARAAMIFVAKALPPNPFDPISYRVLQPGMAEVLSRMIAQCSTVTVLTRSPVQGVWRDVSPGGGGFTVSCAHRPPVKVDHLVLASSGPPTARLLAGLPGTALQMAALNGIEFHHARLALHTDPLYAPQEQYFRSFLNSDVQGAFCEASMWLASVVAGPPEATAKLWKSWITHRPRPMQVLYETEFAHMLPTPATLHAQATLDALQGQDGIWFAGGYLHPYDSQETALLSAVRVALAIHSGASYRAAFLEHRAQDGEEEAR
jgi:predicted NAD/FAD-binding protein